MTLQRYRQVTLSAGDGVTCGRPAGGDMHLEADVTRDTLTPSGTTQGGDTGGSASVTSRGRPPLTRERHAELVDWLMHNKPRAGLLLLHPLDYVFDPCPVCVTRAGRYPHSGCGVSLMLEMQQLRIAFMSVRDWESAMAIIQALLDKDREVCRVSVGVRINGRVVQGESIE